MARDSGSMEGREKAGPQIWSSSMVLGGELEERCLLMVSRVCSSLKWLRGTIQALLIPIHLRHSSPLGK